MVEYYYGAFRQYGGNQDAISFILHARVERPGELMIPDEVVEKHDVHRAPTEGVQVAPHLWHKVDHLPIAEPGGKVRGVGKRIELAKRLPDKRMSASKAAFVMRTGTIRASLHLRPVAARES